MNFLELLSKKEDCKFQSDPYTYNSRIRDIIFNKLYYVLDYFNERVLGNSEIIKYFDKNIIDFDYFNNIISKYKKPSNPLQNVPF